MEVVVEGICPQYDFVGAGSIPVPRVRYAVSPCPLLKRVWSQARKLSFRSEVQGRIYELPQTRRVGGKIRQTRSKRSQPRPFVDHAERIGVQWPAVRFVIVR